MDTEKLYDRDAFLKEFDAVVTDCRPGKGDTYLVTLDRTAFYPEGGGQPADHGDLGSAAVLDVQERDGLVLHTCDQPLTVGAESPALGEEAGEPGVLLGKVSRPGGHDAQAEALDLLR